jgi:NAD(P)-dependent dehydrogenase (short-subunit alcohol dehydrogenase family)
MATTDSPAPAAYVITGPTSGIGYRTALELAKHGTVVLVGRDLSKLSQVEQTIERAGGQAVTIVGDLSDITSTRRAAAEIIALSLPLAGLVNNAGIGMPRAGKNAQGWDMVFATNHLGPFALTEALIPGLPDGATVVFVASGVEDPERRPATIAGFRGARYISAEASARGEWKPGGSSLPGLDAYATSKQGNLAAALAFARETPRSASSRSSRASAPPPTSGATPTPRCTSCRSTCWPRWPRTSSTGAPPGGRPRSSPTRC